MSSSDKPSLVVQGGPLEGRALSFGGAQGERLLGSAESANLLLPGANVEAAHARLSWNEQGVQIVDLSKQHGTFLNGERVEQAAEVGHGDRICLGPPGDPGSVKLLVRLPGPPGDYPAEEGPPEPAETEAAGPGADAVAAAHSGEWGAVDDDDQVMAAAAPAEAPPVAPGVARTTVPSPPPGRVPTARVRKPTRAPRPTGPRVLMLGLGAALLAGAAYLGYVRWQRPAPILETLLPPKAEPGQTIQITGTGFESDPARNQVTFEDKPAQVIAASDTQLSVVVPQGLATDDKPQHRVRVQARGEPSNTLFFRVYLAPKVSRFEPDVALPGDTVSAIGENFGDDTSVLVGGKPADVIETQPSLLRFKVPELAVSEGKALPVGVQVGKNAARLVQLLIGKLPLVLQVTPPRGVPGERVTVKGRGFDPATGGSAVRFGETTALVLGASESELLVVVPGVSASAGQKEVALSVRARGSQSSGTPFVVSRASSAVFLPRFFPEPAADPDTVVISSELGPFLRLRGKADAPSTAERAARVAAGLNAAMERAVQAPLQVELRESPEPAVVVAGVPQPIVVATAADTQAYATSRPTARALARHWTALFQDYLALFAQRQRPFRVLELSPRGQVLLELYSSAERRGGTGSGVPPSVVEGLTGSQVRALAEMALSVPDQPVASGAAVAGRWDGTLDETGRAVRAIQVRLATGGAQLTGSFLARVGALSAELPLTDVSYRNGSLSFIVALGGSPRRFTGKVDGRNVEGQVQSSDGKAVGRFALRWVE